MLPDYMMPVGHYDRWLRDEEGNYLKDEEGNYVYTDENGSQWIGPVPYTFDPADMVTCSHCGYYHNSYGSGHICPNCNEIRF